MGRAYLPPFHAQQHQPLPDDGLSVRFRRASKWWEWYLSERPPAVRRPVHHYRKRCYMWTDAAGASKGLAAVLWFEGRFYFTAAKTPDHVWTQFIPRGDNQIGCQEMLAVVLGLCTFADLIRDSL